MIVEGMLNVRPGATVKAVPLNSSKAGAKPRRRQPRPHREIELTEFAMLSNFFLERPVFAWVIAIIMMLAGALAIYNLPISQYPPIAPPSIAIDAFYPGLPPKPLKTALSRSSSRR